jgi:CO/xanthine dehydrogenase FAD-binding subunit
MQHFKFYSAKTITECTEFLSHKKEMKKVIAGGTDLIPALRNEAILPDHVLNIMEVQELKRIEETDDSIIIGPAVTFRKIIDSKLLNRELTLICKAASVVGSPQIRNRGTIGGNIITSSPCADVLPALMALESDIELRSKKFGKRIIPIDSLVRSAYDVDIRFDEIATGIIIKKQPPGTKFGFEKVGRRNALARARMSISIVLRLTEEDKVADIHIVPGAVMPAPMRMRSAEDMFIDKKVTDELIEEAGILITEEIVKVTGIRDSTEYKEPVFRNIFRRVMKGLVEQGK